MMGKTHIAIGIATSMIVFHPTDAQSCIIAVTGGALGGTVADVDILKNDYKHDAFIAQTLAIVIAAVSLSIDYILNLGVCNFIISRNLIISIVGFIAYMILYVIGFISTHRTITHSLLSLILFSIAIRLSCPMLTPAYVVGYLSHLFLDIMNKKKVPVFYPKGKGFCFNWCYANKWANTFFMWAGFSISILLVINAVVYHFY